MADDIDYNLHIRRDYARDNPCTFCGPLVAAHTDGRDLHLIVENDEIETIFCPYHENELLSRLLNNWVRRSRRRKNPWPIPKEDLCYLCGDILNDAKEPEEGDDATD